MLIVIGDPSPKAYFLLLLIHALPEPSEYRD